MKKVNVLPLVRAYPGLFVHLFTFTGDLVAEEVLDAVFVHSDTQLYPGDELLLTFLKRYIQECNREGKSGYFRQYCSLAKECPLTKWYRSEYYVPSGLNFEATGGSVIQLFAWRASKCCKHDMGSLSWYNTKTLKTATPLWQTCKILPAHGRSFTRLKYNYVLLYM